MSTTITEQRNQLRDALKCCVESLRLLETQIGAFPSWSHPAVSLRMADAALAEAQKRDEWEDELPAEEVDRIFAAIDRAWVVPPERLARIRERFEELRVEEESSPK